MKKIILYAVAALACTACGNRSGNAKADLASDAGVNAGTELAEDAAEKHTEAYIRQRIDTIYATVGKSVYDSEGNELNYMQNPFNRDSAYCSERYYALMREASKLCDETDDVLYDFDYWVCGQDFSEDWSCQVAKVYNMTDSSALVDLNVHNFGDTETTIALRYERGDWYIDDFSPSDDGNDDKAYLRTTIQRCKDLIFGNTAEAMQPDEGNNFLMNFYEAGEECDFDKAFLKRHLTDRALQYLKDQFDYEDETGEGMATWLFYKYDTTDVGPMQNFVADKVGEHTYRVVCNSSHNDDVYRYLVLFDLVKVGGQWKIDSMKPLSGRIVNTNGDDEE